jgi:hypothetical protein
MIQLLVTGLILIGSQAFSAIQNSKLELRHQELIQNSLLQSCGSFRNLKEVQTTVIQQQVDQGIIDYYFTSLFHFTIRVDNGVFDQYKALVRSSYHSAYDHQSGHWGLYQVNQVNCEPR